MILHWRLSAAINCALDGFKMVQYSENQWKVTANQFKYSHIYIYIYVYTPFFDWYNEIRESCWSTMQWANVRAMIDFTKAPLPTRVPEQLKTGDYERGRRRQSRDRLWLIKGASFYNSRSVNKLSLKKSPEMWRDHIIILRNDLALLKCVFLKRA